MTKETRYICDRCSVSYETEKEALKCEAKHPAIKEVVAEEYFASSQFPYTIVIKFNNGWCGRYKK